MIEIEEPLYTHSIIPAGSVDLLTNESPLISLDETKWLVRRVVEGSELLTLQEVIAIKDDPDWFLQS